MKKKNFIYRIIEEEISRKKIKNICTRFPPDPNGNLHIGHVKSIYLNFNIAKYYNGNFNLRIDDTNPSEESEKYTKEIINDIRWLGLKWNGKIKYSSEYFEKFYEYAIYLIKKNLAYVDELSKSSIRKYRGTLKTPGKNSPYRDRSISENLKIFENMKNGKFQEGKACLRAKIDMSSPNINMRDPVFYRIKYKKHFRCSYKWCIYPTYDFSHCIADAIEGITHSICTLEFQNNRPLYDWILKSINFLKKPKQYEFSRLNISYMITSKRKINQLIKKNILFGWDDPRIPTISGLRRRGYTANSILKFCSKLGISKQESIVESELLESCIRSDLNKSAPRVMVVLDPIKLIIENMYHKEEMLVFNNHPNVKSVGNRNVPFSKFIYIDRNDFLEKYEENRKVLSIGEKVRLRNSYVIQANSIKKDRHGNILEIYCTYDPKSLKKDFRNKEKLRAVIHWVSVIHGITIKVNLYDKLFTIKHPFNYKEIESIINPLSLIVKKGIAEPSLANSKPGEIFQFEREGYFCADLKEHNSKNLIFNRIVELKRYKFNKKRKK
ncbi:glutamine--tRNA ligase [Candidatus Riesia sp. GBBU]|nr:glutamine--tRNA ligase [Candidatus Riesia sp. GBBU]